MVEQIGYANIADKIEHTKDIDRPLVIDFRAPWCGPCRVLSPIVDEVSEEMGDDIDFAKIDVERYGEAALEHGVMSIPTLIVFKDGKEVNRIIGTVSKHGLIKELKDSIA